MGATGDMMTFIRRTVLSIVIIAIPAFAAAESIYTSVKSDNCQDIKPPLDKLFESRGLDAEECNAPGGWRLFVASTDPRSWIELSYGKLLWSTAQPVVYDKKYRFGNFPNIDSDSGKVEWRLSQSKEPYALIFRVHAINDTSDKNLTRLFVIRITNNIPYFCGTAKTNAEARKLADSTQGCTQKLEQLLLPE